MTREEIIHKILELAREDEEAALLEMTISIRGEDLYDAALAEFGGWDAALVAALRQAVRATPAKSKSRTAAREDLPSR